MNEKAIPGLKPQDILVALKLHLMRQQERPRLVDLGMELGLSQAEVSGSIKRAINSGLSEPENGVPYTEALKEFIIHGLKFVFPSQVGPVSKGMPTSISMEPLKSKINSSEAFVWPDAEGKLKGHSIVPIYPSAPAAAKKDSKLHELLSLIDAIRVGQARERKLAEKELVKRLSK